MNKVVFSLIMSILILSTLPVIKVSLSQEEKIYVAFIWHYHQPWYYSVDETYFILPWVRMHSVGNYYKMAYILSKYSDIRVTFTFSGSLLEQLIDIIEKQKKDLRWIISERIVNNSLTERDVFEMLKIPGGFFDINWARIVDRSPRFRELRDLAQNAFRTCSRIARSEEELIKCVVNNFAPGNLYHQRVIDLAVLFNLLWIDPQVAREQYPQINELMRKAYESPTPSFTKDDLKLVLDIHYDIISKIPNIYRELANKGQIELTPVPYSHPLSPIIVDLGFREDLEIHVEKSIELFGKYFNYQPRGVWPAEQGINEYVAESFRNAGVEWTVTDEAILGKTGVNTGDINNIGVPWYIDFPRGRIHIFFRNTELSNLISFQYAGWNYRSAVEDLVNKILGYRSGATGPRIVVIALDGENPWEHYEEFGTLFLNELYNKLTEIQKQGVLETITPGEFISRFSNTARALPQRQYVYLDLESKDISNLPPDSYGDAYDKLPRRTVNARLPEGSWAGGELAIWIGHRQENIATMWLTKARSEILNRSGLNSFRDLHNQYPDVAKYLLKAEASDWWWWYGGDGGGSPAPFDPLFKTYLRRAYELAGLTPPDYLNVYAYPDGTPIGVLNTDVPLPTTTPPVMDGVIENTWVSEANAGRGLRIVIGNIVHTAYVLLDSTSLYLAFNASRVDDVLIGVYFNNPTVSLSPYSPEYNVYPRRSRVDLGIYLMKEILVSINERKASIAKATGGGEWSVVKTIGVNISEQRGMYHVELSIPWGELGLPQGVTIHFAIATYVNEEVVDYSSRLGLVHQFQIPREALIGRVVFEMTDPIGDDDGPGGVKYPTNPVFQKGVFDLTNFKVMETNDKVIFIAQFAKLGGNPWGGPNGWSLQQVHIYIHTTLGKPGKTEMIALNARIVEEHAWHMAILLAPGWDTDPIPAGEKSGIYYFDKDKPVVQNGNFKVYADPVTNSITAEISKNLLYDVENIDKWIYVVAVYSYDGYGRNRIREVVAGEPEEWRLGAPPEYALAVINGVFPYILDLLAPTAEDQYRMLRSFDAQAGLLATVRGYGSVTQQTTTPIETTTPVESPTETPTATPPAEQVLEPWLIVLIVVVLVVLIAIVLLVTRRKS